MTDPNQGEEMTTTEAAPVVEETPRPPCPKCGKPTLAVEGTDVRYCNACGQTTGGAITPDEVLDNTSSTAVDTRPTESGAAAAMDRAVDAALTIPGIPGRDEFLSLAAQARMLSLSGAAPKAIRNHPHIAFHVAMIGRDLGISPSSAMNLIDVIGDPDKHDDVQLSLSPELLVGQVQRLGLGDVKTIHVDYYSATAVALRPGGHVSYDKDGNVTEIVGEIGRATFSWDDALEADLVDERCTPPTADVRAVHWKKPGTRGKSYEDRCRCRQGWRTYSKRMLSWRAQGYAVADNFASASLGLYSPEELGAVVDETGRAIDPADVELPEGYEPDRPPAAEPATDEAKAEIRRRVAALPENRREEFIARWGEKVQEGRLAPVPDLLGSQVALALALLQGAESQAKKDGWIKPEEGLKPSEAPEAPETPPAPVDVPETAQEPGDAESGPDAAQPAEPTREQIRAGQLDAQRNLAAPALTDDLLARASSIVAQLTDRQLAAHLRQRQLDASTKISRAVRQQHLVDVMACEMAEVDWNEANGAPPPSDPAGTF
jgi:ribosomal protein L37AE/L43A